MQQRVTQKTAPTSNFFHGLRIVAACLPLAACDTKQSKDPKDPPLPEIPRAVVADLPPLPFGLTEEDFQQVMDRNGNTLLPNGRESIHALRQQISLAQKPVVCFIDQFRRDTEEAPALSLIGTYPHGQIVVACAPDIFAICLSGVNPRENFVAEWQKVQKAQTIVDYLLACEIDVKAVNLSHGLALHFETLNFLFESFPQLKTPLSRDNCRAPMHNLFADLSFFSDFSIGAHPHGSLFLEKLERLQDSDTSLSSWLLRLSGLKHAAGESADELDEKLLSEFGTQLHDDSLGGREALWQDIVKYAISLDDNRSPWNDLSRELFERYAADLLYHHERYGAFDRSSYELLCKNFNVAINMLGAVGGFFTFVENLPIPVYMSAGNHPSFNLFAANEKVQLVGGLDGEAKWERSPQHEAVDTFAQALIPYRVAPVDALTFDAQMCMLFVPESVAEEHPQLPREGMVSGTSIAAPQALQVYLLAEQQTD